MFSEYVAWAWISAASIGFVGAGVIVWLGPTRVARYVSLSWLARRILYFVLFYFIVAITLPYLSNLTRAPILSHVGETLLLSTRISCDQVTKRSDGSWDISGTIVIDGTKFTHVMGVKSAVYSISGKDLYTLLEEQCGRK
jgi:hypothetical protein